MLQIIPPIARAGRDKKERINGAAQRQGSIWSCRHSPAEMRSKSDVLEVCALRRSRERDHITDIAHPGDELHRSLEAKPEAGMRDGAEAPQIKIPPIIL